MEFHREERFLLPEDLYQADEVFITSSLKEVMPVTQIDKNKIGLGVPGAITLTIGRKLS